MISNFAPVSRCLLKRRRKTPTGYCSNKLWNNSMAASQILERWSCCIQHHPGTSRLEDDTKPTAPTGRREVEQTANESFLKPADNLPLHQLEQQDGLGHLV